MSTWTIDVLMAARRVADLAKAEGALDVPLVFRPTTEHMGAAIADAVLQSGLNYVSVVRPRIISIIQRHPRASRLSEVMRIVEAKHTSEFLGWQHPTKIERFESLASFLAQHSIEIAADLRERIGAPEFQRALRTIRGIGPKTVDYLACLVGHDAIAVDRHISTYAQRAGVKAGDYEFLREAFCSAADLLSMPRRGFDAWVWQRQASGIRGTQLALRF